MNIDFVSRATHSLGPIADSRSRKNVQMTYARCVAFCYAVDHTLVARRLRAISPLDSTPSMTMISLGSAAVAKQSGNNRMVSNVSGLDRFLETGLL